jgi:lipopolysaccharide export system protein LptA
MIARMILIGLTTLAILGVCDFGPVLAQFATASGHDTSQPIEITADSMEVDQDQQTAIFEGTVEAVQGELHLRADRVTVHYRDKAEGGGKEIARIEAVGNVFVSSPEETAQGASGVYDVPGRTIALEGDVVLTRGENVIRGERLELDLRAGVSRIEGGAGGRVKGLFLPESEAP